LQERTNHTVVELANNTHIEQRRDNAMPASTPRPKPFVNDDEKEKENSNGYVRPAFVRCDLTSDQKKELAEWANGRSADDLFDYINESTEEGYVLSIKPAEKGYQSSLTQSKKAAIGVPNIGKSLVTRASTPERCIWSLYYKHREVLAKDWTKGNVEAELDW
jgi:hypothetical protein